MHILPHLDRSRGRGARGSFTIFSPLVKDHGESLVGSFVVGEFSELLIEKFSGFTWTDSTE